MHSFSVLGLAFNYNSDFSGPIIISKQTGREMGVPFEVLKQAVAVWAAALLKERIAKASPDEVLQNRLPFISNFSLRESFHLEIEAHSRDGGKHVVQYFPDEGPADSYLLISNTAGQRIAVDFDATKSFVGLYLARNFETRLCDLQPDQIFQLSTTI